MSYIIDPFFANTVHGCHLWSLPPWYRTLSSFSKLRSLEFDTSWCLFRRSSCTLHLQLRGFTRINMVLLFRTNIAKLPQKHQRWSEACFCTTKANCSSSDLHSTSLLVSIIFFIAYLNDLTRTTAGLAAPLLCFLQ